MNTEQGRQALRHFTVTRNWQPLQMALLKSILKKRVHIGLLAVQARDSAYKAYLKCNDATIFGPFINNGFDLEKKLSAGDVISIPSQYMDYYSTASATLIILTT